MAYEQITKQLHKLISVHKITDLTNDKAIERELVLFKVAAPPERRSEIIEISNIFRAKIVDVGKKLVDDRGDGNRRQASRALRTCSALTASRRSSARKDRHGAQLEGVGAVFSAFCHESCFVFCGKACMLRLRGLIERL